MVNNIVSQLMHQYHTLCLIQTASLPDTFFAFMIHFIDLSNKTVTFCCSLLQMM